MKKLFLAVALVLGLGTFAMANDMRMMVEVTSSVSADEFKMIDVKDVPQAVQDAVAKDYAGQTIKSAAVEEKDGAKIYQLTLAAADGTETTVLFNEKGEVQK